jgi:cysteinyl-tRNA synthetase
MALRLHDTLTDTIIPFTPQELGHARVYVCGPTVYDFAHLGHLRSILVYDVLVRHLRQSGLRVTYVRNITDINDKIFNRAKENNEEPLALAERMAAAFTEDAQRLGCLPPDIEPKVSTHLAEIEALIQRLIEANAAYASDGDVYFRVEAFPTYGKLSHRKLSDLVMGGSGRVNDEETRRKENPADFALWKSAKPGEPSWPSPWGPGHPGWHIECSAMSMKHLGESFDIHGGGLDLVFPHHENEIAQCEAVTGKPLAQLWVHNGFIEVNKEKMSKSLGNFFTAREVFRHVEPEAVRYFLMTSNYRAPLNLDWDVDDAGQVTGFPQISDAERRVEYIYATRERLAQIPTARITPEGVVPESLKGIGRSINRALNDDLNFPSALAAVSEFLKNTNELVDGALRKKGSVAQGAIDAATQGLNAIAERLGLGADNADAITTRIRARRIRAIGLTEADVEREIAARIAARNGKDFAKADGIRDSLAARGIELMDGTEGTRWRVA